METLAYDPFLTREQIEEEGCALAGRLRRNARGMRFCPVHVPLLPETKGMIGERHLAQMKKTAMIINCARGGIVDEQALADALNSGLIAGAGVDVFGEEPPAADNPLLGAKYWSAPTAQPRRRKRWSIWLSCAWRGALPS